MSILLDLGIDLVITGIACGTIATTLTRSKITKGLKEWMVKKKGDNLFTQLLTCPYCMVHWIALVFSLAFYTTSLSVFIVNTFCLVGIGALFSGILQKVWLLQENEIADLYDLLKEAQGEINK